MIPRNLNITQEILKQPHISNDIAIRRESSLSWGALTEKVEDIAAVLKDQFQVKKGDTVLVRAMNIPEIAVSVLSSMRIGAVPCMTSRLYMKNELEYALENSRAQTGITPSEISLPLTKIKEESGKPANLISIGEKVAGTDNFSQLLASPNQDALIDDPTDSEDPAFVMYTSGSTGVPKGVVHAHRWLLGSARIVGSEMMHLTPQDVVYCPQEISFLHGFAWGFIAPLYFGSSIVLLPTRSGTSPESFFEILEKYRVTVFVSVTTMFRNMLKLRGAEEKYDLSSLRMCITGGDPLYPKEFEEWQSRFKIGLLETMAQSEIGIYTGYPENKKVKPGSCGLPLAGHEVKVVDDLGKEVGRGTVGNLVISESDPGLFKEYLQMPDATKASRKNGWYYTKDMAYFDDDGYLWFCGRSDDMFKSRGYLISPQEIEKTIMEHPAIAESCIIPVPDERTGNRIKAFVCLKPGYHDDVAEELKDFLFQRIAAYKVPKEIEIIQEVPKTITGKLKRSELRASKASEAN
jgi:acetyl-CoA synthetase